jgi:D-3-phosphoglycerate dehydrogenase
LLARSPAGADDLDLERAIYGEAASLRVGPRKDGRYLLEGPEFLASLEGANAIVVYRCRVTEPLLRAAGTGLKVVARQGVGIDNLNLPLLQRSGIRSFNLPDYCVDEVASHTIGLALALERRIVPQHLALSAGRFDVYHGGVPRRLQRRTAGIVGFGRIGRAVSQRLKLFYGEVVAFDPYVSDDLMAGYGIAGVAFDELLQRSDAVFLHCPLTEETAALVNERSLARIKPGAILVNCARGGIVDSQALYNALREGRLGGAALDVFVPEDPHQDRFYARIVTMENVVVTSHRAFLSTESEASVRRRVAQAVRDVLLAGSGQAPVGWLS